MCLHYLVLTEIFQLNYVFHSIEQTGSERTQLKFTSQISEDMKSFEEKF
jgi:hypothetical protein